MSHTLSGAEKRFENVFVLACANLPADVTEFEAALEDGVRHFAQRPEKMVSIKGATVEALDEITIDLSGATVDLEARPPQAKKGAASSITARHFLLRADPVRLRGRELRSRIDGEEVAFAVSPTDDGKLILALKKVARGQAEFSISAADLQQLLTEVAREKALAQGVTVDDLRLDLRTTEGRAVDVKIIVAARKIVFRATLNITGTLTIDDEFVAHFSNLKCRGEGAIAAVASAAISSQFSKIENKAFPLSALPLGGARVRNMELRAENGMLSARAELGS